MKRTQKSIERIGFIKNIAFIGVLVFSLISLAPWALSQADQPEKGTTGGSALTVFLDCETCDLEFIQQQVRFASFVKDRNQAQVVVLISTKEIEGGVEYTLAFKGQKEFEKDDDLLKYRADKKDEAEKTKGELANTLKMGLMRYVGKTPISNRISISLMDTVKPTAVADKWNFWVFSISAEAFVDGEKLYKSGMYYGSLSANRVTPDLKIRLSLGVMYNRSEFTYDDQVIVSTSDSKSFSGLVVKSLNEHWSAGAYFSAFSSNYTNVGISLSPAPAIEYNVFPYSESTKKQLRFLYRVGFNSVRYREETIYLKTYENLWNESLSMTVEVNQKWGTVSTSLEGSHYFHDFRKNRVQLWGSLSLRLFRGLNLNIYGSYSRIRDQLSLPREGATLEEILLRLRQLATTYSYYLSVGLSYTFGSTQSNVVNPRFGEGGRSVSISF